MFTRSVLWLLVACIPGLLMLATLGLGRLEKALAHDTVSATDVAEFLQLAEAVDVHTLAREGMPEALDYLHRRQALELTDGQTTSGGKHHAGSLSAHDLMRAAEAGLPTRVHRHARANQQFTATRHVNRV